MAITFYGLCVCVCVCVCVFLVVILSLQLSVDKYPLNFAHNHVLCNIKVCQDLYQGHTSYFKNIWYVKFYFLFSLVHCNSALPTCFSHPISYNLDLSVILPILRSPDKHREFSLLPCYSTTW